MVFKERPRIIFVIFCTFFLVSAKTSNEKVIYGKDNRRDLFELNNSRWIHNSRGIAALVLKRKIKNIPGYPGIVELKTEVMDDLCEDEKFYGQGQLASCSGFLVGKNLLVTAGHCIKSLKECKKNRWVFGFDLGQEDKDYTKISKKNIYECVEIIDYSLDDSTDFSLLRLNRDVFEREPLAIREVGKVKIGEALYLGGHPSGLPLKMSGHAWVRKNSNENYFSANLDSFEGNSGGPVFNSNDHFVEGILVRGEDDYIWDDKRDCFKVKKCLDWSCSGEEVTRISAIKRLKDLINEEKFYDQSGRFRQR
ncbi:MAG: serine protease [Bdellovibrionota bacterium]|nr:serine protease [Bdellovibrionota bacterium]